MDLMIGCPVYRRDWILPDWFAHAEIACEAAGVNPTYVFATSPDDETTNACLVAHGDMLGREVVVLPTNEDSSAPEVRNWTDARRLNHMVYVRNVLLEGVRERSPSFFLSLDSDILLHPLAVEGLLESAEQYEAVGGKVYLSKTGTRAPSHASLRHGRIAGRLDVPYLCPAGAIMAIKLLSPKAYGVDYKYHVSGEDIGWSVAAAAAGVKLGHDGRYVSKHVWAPGLLNVVDKRVGF